MSEVSYPELMMLLKQYWPILALVVVGGWLVLRPRRRTESAPPLDPHQAAAHQIKLSLGCNEQQARELLRIYNGDAQLAIMEVKSGQAALPGSQTESAAEVGGRVRRILLGEEAFALVSPNESSESFPLDQRGVLAVGVLECNQRPDKDGFVDAPRGRLHGQLFLELDGEWRRYHLDSGKLDYNVLGAARENTASRNFRALLKQFTETVPGIRRDASLEKLLSEMKAPVYSKLADFEQKAQSDLIE